MKKFTILNKKSKKIEENIQESPTKTISVNPDVNVLQEQTSCVKFFSKLFESIKTLSTLSNCFGAKIVFAKLLAFVKVDCVLHNLCIFVNSFINSFICFSEKLFIIVDNELSSFFCF